MPRYYSVDEHREAIGKGIVVVFGRALEPLSVFLRFDDPTQQGRRHPSFPSMNTHLRGPTTASTALLEGCITTTRNRSEFVPIRSWASLDCGLAGVNDLNRRNVNEFES